MQSPFNDSSNVGGGWGPGSLASGLLQYYNQTAQQGISTLGGIAGGFIGGGIAGLSAPDQPGQPASSGISKFMSGGAQGALGEANPQYKKLQAAGKSADYFMQAGGDDAYAAMGIHPDEWKTLGARDKVAAVQGFMEQRAAQNQAEQIQALSAERRAKAAEYQMRLEESQAIPAFAQELMKARQDAPPAAAPAPAAPGTDQMMNWQPGMPWNGPANEFDGRPMMGQPDGGTAGTGTMGAAAPSAGTASSASGATFSPQEMMGAMSRMGSTNPRLGAAMMRVLIPKMMNGEMSNAPQFIKSPEGNPYVFMNHTLMPDRPQMDLSSMMGAAPEGYQAVMTGPNRAQFLKTAKVLPESFHSILDKVTSEIADEQSNLDKQDSEYPMEGDKPMSPENIKALKARAQRRLDSAQKRGKATIDRYVTGGYISPDAKADYYDQLGLSAPADRKATKEAEGAKGSPAVNTQALIQEANKAIAAGADPAKVKARLKEKYGLEIK